jgi:gamma-glutamylcyclotransferase (GGCT)/AIG2-like uncharacterized protein YtfP
MNVFVYGTLMDEKIRYEELGRKISGIPATLDGYDSSKTIIIENESYPAAEKNIECSIKGSMIELTLEEISKLDVYETDAYKKEEVELTNGIKAWIYLNKNSE